MSEIVKIFGIEAINDDIEEFSCRVYKVLDDDSYYEDFPDRTDKFRVSRTKDKKMFEFLMDAGMRDGKKICYGFIKKELKLLDAQDKEVEQK